MLAMVRRDGVSSAAGLTRPWAVALIATACAALAACSSDRLAGAPATTGSVESLPAAPSGQVSAALLPAPGGAGPSAAPADMAGRWQLSGADGRRCGMAFALSATGSGTIAPEGGCPGKFYMSRSFVFDQSGALVIRDHTGSALAHLASSGPGRFEGRGQDGQPVVLER